MSDSFAARFRLARKRKKLTQVAVADALGVSQSAVVYCSPVLRHSAGLIQAANFRSAVVF